MSISSSGKVAVIGEKSVTRAFKALGWDVFDNTEPDEIKQTLKTLTEQQYSVILVTQKCFSCIPESDRANDAAYPVVLPIPDPFTH